MVIVGNGYESTKQQAVLFILDLKTGHLIRTLNTQTGSTTQPNGLSTPISIDIDADKSVDRVYAGDLLGNVWRFDLTNPDPKQWTVAFSNKPLFRACEDNDCKKTQAITAKLQVGKHEKSGVMVYFGTDQNIVDRESVVNSFYAVRDNNTRVLSNKKLVEQKVLQENSVGSSLEMRVTTNDEVNYDDKQGWFLKLAKSFSQLTGERVSTQALLREGQLVISTEIPLEKSCSGAYQSRWLMKLDALQGRRLEKISFDTNHDNKLTLDDNAEYERQSTIVSGIRLNSSGSTPAMPLILTEGDQNESTYSLTDSGSVKSLKTSVIKSSGRVLWRQLR